MLSWMNVVLWITGVRIAPVAGSGPAGPGRARAGGCIQCGKVHWIEGSALHVHKNGPAAAAGYIVAAGCTWLG